MPKQSPPKDRPDFRSGGPNDPSAWTPARTYAHLCRCFRRKPGYLSLMKQEFEAAQIEYVSRGLQARRIRFRLTRAPAPPRALVPKRSYTRRTRTSVLESEALGKEWWRREMEVRRRLLAAEFAWSMLCGEGKALRRQRRSNAPVEKVLRERYHYVVPQAIRKSLAEDINSSPWYLASEEIAGELGITGDGLRVLLAPSQRRRASLPAELARMNQSLIAGQEEPHVLGRRRRSKRSRQK